MDEKLNKYTVEIIEKFRLSKISSVTINGILYDDYNKIPKDLKIEKLQINKKYIKLFDDEEYILNNFINNREMLVKNKKTGRYICLKISDHAKIRLLTRYLVLYLKYKDFLGNKILSIMDKCISEFIEGYKSQKINNDKELQKYINTFIKKTHKETIDVAIYELFKNSKTLKNISKKFKKRENEYGPTNLFIMYPFVLIYDINTNLIKTIEIHELSKQDVETKRLRQDLNKRVNDLNFILKLLKSKTL